MNIAAVGKAFPVHRHSQREITAVLQSLWSDQPAVVDRLIGLHAHTRVEARNLALPLSEYTARHTFGAMNDRFIEVATDLGERAILMALERAGLRPAEIDVLVFVSVTGISSPSIDARLMNRLRLRPDVKRLPLFGLGCVAGAAGIARAADCLRAFPEQVAVLLSVELCSLTFQREDTSVAHLISTGLFGDGAAAVVLTGSGRSIPGPEIVATRSIFYPDTEQIMGWHIGERGFEIVLSAQVPEVARSFLGPDVDRFLFDHGLARKDIGAWICHPGGPKVLSAMQQSLCLDDKAMRFAWQELAMNGNLSSASVLHVLERQIAEGAPVGTFGLLCAMGPGFCSELVLLRF